MVSQGVPQGSVLSPLLFNVVMAGIKTCVPRKVNVSIYADDICVWTAGKSRPALRYRLQRSLDAIVSYLTQAGMDISAEKSAVLAFTRKQMHRFRFLVGTEPLSLVSHHRFLGVILDSNLSWKRHVTYLEGRTQRWVNVIRHFAGMRWGRDETDLLMLHNALVRGSVMYSLPVLHGLSKALEQRLRALLARSLRVCLGLPRGAETRLVVAEARDIPIEVLRDRETVRHYLRLLAHHRRHPLVRKLRNRRHSNIQACITTFRSGIPDFTVTPTAPPTPPWTFPSPVIFTSIPGLRGKRQQFPAAVLLQLALEFVTTMYANRTAVYTDGSSTRESSSAAFVLPSESVSRGCRLSHHTSSTSAELYAVLLFLQYASSCTSRHWVVYTDSKGALQCMANMGIRGSLAPIVVRVLTLLKTLEERGHTFVFQWIPGHCGIRGNEEADAAAAAAHQRRTTVPIVFPRGDRRSYLRRVTAGLADQQRRRDVPAQSLLHTVDPALSCRLPRNLPRPVKSLLHRLRLNVAFTPFYRHQLGCAISPCCPECAVPATVDHLLLFCRQYTREREYLRAQYEAHCSRPLTLPSILGPWDTPVSQRTALRFVVEFLRLTGLLDIL